MAAPRRQLRSQREAQAASSSSAAPISSTTWRTSRPPRSARRLPKPCLAERLSKLPSGPTSRRRRARSSRWAQVCVRRRALASLIRESQDLAASRPVLDKSLLAALSTPQGQQGGDAVGAVRAQIAEAQQRAAALAARLKKSSRILLLSQSQSLSASTRCRRCSVPGRPWSSGSAAATESYVFAATRAGLTWKAIPLGKAALSQKVAEFRRGLDVDEWRRSIAAGKPVMFDPAVAHELYGILLGPVEAMIKGKPSHRRADGRADGPAVPSSGHREARRGSHGACRSTATWPGCSNARPSPSCPPSRA